MPLDPVPTDLLQCHDASVVSKYLRYFVLEARTQDCKKYPPTTIRSLLSGLNRILEESKAPFSILDKGNPAFRELLLTLDTVTSDLHKALCVYERTSEVQERSAGQCIQSGTSFDPISLIEDKENCNPVPSVAPTSSFSGTGVPKALQQFSGLTGCTFNFYHS